VANQISTLSLFAINVQPSTRDQLPSTTNKCVLWVHGHLPLCAAYFTYCIDYWCKP